MTNKEAVVAPSTPTFECCMCGDCGLPHELFRCRVCLFRSQHRYCSNLYPKAKSYRVCNWCLQKEGRNIERTQNSSLSFSSKNNNINEDEDKKKKKKNSNSNSNTHVDLKIQKGTSQLQLNNPIKKQIRSLDRSVARKKIIESELSLRRTKSEEIANAGIKQLFRGKVRRYKLLEEVSSQ